MPTESSTQVGTLIVGTLPPDTHPPGGSPDGPPVVPGYEVGDVLGRGGMGVVYTAVQISLRRVVALKMLPGGHIADEVRARFRQEGEAVARLQHPNIVQIFEIGEAGGSPFLALEFVAGGPLNRFLGGRPQPIPLAAELAATLARAIDHAHQRGILHRDLKPGNVLMTEAQTPATVKITDFGLAKSLHAADGPTRFGEVLGTPSYMAPEQAGGVTRTLTAAVDVYAIGAILYETITGRPPFLAADLTETVLQVLSKEPLPPRHLRPDCARDLETICLKCLEKTPARRYATAAALADDLDAFLAGKPIRARPAGPVERLAKWARRKPAQAALFGGGLVAVLAVVLAGALYTVQLRQHNAALRSANERERAARERAQANFTIARQTVKEVLAEVAARDLASVPHFDPSRKALLRGALTRMRDLLGQDRDNPLLRRDIARTAGDVGELHELLGELRDAETHLRDSADLYRELVHATPEDLELDREWAMARMRLANLLTASARYAEAEPLFDGAAASMERLCADRTDAAEYRHDLGRVLLNRGLMRTGTRRRADAEADFLRARDEFERACRADPDNPGFRERLGAAHVNLGVFHREHGRLGPAAEAYNAGLTVLLELSHQYPDRRSTRTALGTAARNLGFARWWLNDNPGAGAAYRLSVNTFERLTRDFPHIPDYRYALTRSYQSLGEMLDYDDRPDGWQYLRLALEMNQALADDHSGVTEYQIGLAVIGKVFGMSRKRKENWSAADRWFGFAAERAKAALRQDPENPRYRTQLAETLTAHADVLVQLSRPEEARRAATDMAALVPHNGEAAFRAAILVARCVPFRGDAAGGYGDDVVALLRQAVSAGWRDPKRLTDAPELEAVRRRAAYAELLATIRASQN